MPAAPRLEFRKWRAGDLALAQKLWGDPDVMRFIDVRGGLDREQVQIKLNEEIAREAELGLSYWPMFETSSGAFVGASGLKPWVHSPRGGLELGFHLVREQWGKGFAAEAARNVIAYARLKHGDQHLMAGHHPENFGSQKILQNVGFQFLEKVLFKPTGLMHLSYKLELK